MKRLSEAHKWSLVAQALGALSADAVAWAFGFHGLWVVVISSFIGGVVGGLTLSLLKPPPGGHQGPVPRGARWAWSRLHRSEMSVSDAMVGLLGLACPIIGASSVLRLGLSDQPLWALVALAWVTFMFNIGRVLSAARRHWLQSVPVSLAVV